MRASSQVHPSKNAEPAPRSQLHNSVAKNSQKAGATTKKQGAGGKGTWGKVGDEFNGAPSVLDRNDPNFDEEKDSGKTVWSASEE